MIYIKAKKVSPVNWQIKSIEAFLHRRDGTGHRTTLRPLVYVSISASENWTVLVEIWVFCDKKHADINHYGRKGKEKASDMVYGRRIKPNCDSANTADIYNGERKKLPQILPLGQTSTTPHNLVRIKKASTDRFFGRSTIDLWMLLFWFLWGLGEKFQFEIHITTFWW